MDSDHQKEGVELRSDLEHEELKDPERRDALMRMGRFAAYTAPAVVAILAAGGASSKANGASTQPPGSKAT